MKSSTSPRMAKIIENQHLDFERFFHTHYRALFQVGYHLTSDKEWTKDLLQSFFLELWESRFQSQNIQYLDAYLKKAFYRKVIKALQYKNKERDRLNASSHDGNMPSYETQLLNLQTSQQQQQLQIALNQLPLQQSEAIKMCFHPSEKEIRIEFVKFKNQVKQRRQAKFSTIRPLPKEEVFNGNTRVKIGMVGVVLLFLFTTTWQLVWKQNEQVFDNKLTTVYGEVQTHILPDGSKVILNANSQLSYSNWEQASTRKVQLSGEAFFEVVSNKGQPFIVKTDQGMIEVVGTSFNVLQRAKKIEVALLEGAVTLSVPNYPSINMTPGEKVFIEGAIYQQQEADVDALSAWRFQRLVFRDMPIKKVIQRLSDEFNLEIKVQEEKILQRKITATIPANDPTILLETLSEIYDLEIVQQSERAYLIR